LVARLFLSRLYRRYPFFSAYAIFFLVQVVYVATIDTRSKDYLFFYTVTTPLSWIFYVMVVLELYRAVLEEYPGLLTMGRWVMSGSLAVAIVLSALTLLPRLQTPAFQRSKMISYYMVIERGVVCSLMIFLLLILVLLRNFPVRLSRNTIIHSIVYSAFFLSSTLALLLREVFGIRVSSSVNLFIAAFNTVCVFLWAFLLNTKGEARLTSVSSLSPEQEERILTQLHALNTTALRVSRK
jgi:hypothetical protein